MVHWKEFWSTSALLSKVKWITRLLGALPCGSSPLACHALSKLIYELGSKSLQIQLSIYWEVTKTWRGLTSLNEKCSKVSMPFFLGQWLRRVRHAETDKRRKEGKQRPFGLVRKAETESLSWLLYVSSRESKTQKRESFSWRCSPKNREKHSESVREWKRKRRYFSLLTQGR